MKVFLHYEEPMDEDLHMTKQITLPKKWVAGPCSQVLQLFVDTYNKKHPEATITSSDHHLENADGEAVAGASVVANYFGEKADIHVKAGAAPELGAVSAAEIASASPKPAPAAPAASAAVCPPVGTPPAAPSVGPVMCLRFGCQTKYTEAENFEGACRYHRLPPVFHETAKFWACCPDQKCYDWEDFMKVKGCMTGKHSREKPNQQFLGGNDVRAGNDGSAPQKLKSIDEFNQTQGAGGSSAAGEAIAKLYQLRQALDKAGVSGDLFDRAKERVSERLGGDHLAVKDELTRAFSTCLEGLLNS